MAIIMRRVPAYPARRLSLDREAGDETAFDGDEKIPYCHGGP